MVNWAPQGTCVVLVVVVAESLPLWPLLGLITLPLENRTTFWMAPPFLLVVRPPPTKAPFSSHYHPSDDTEMQVEFPPGVSGPSLGPGQQPKLSIISCKLCAQSLLWPLHLGYSVLVSQRGPGLVPLLGGPFMPRACALCLLPTPACD